MAVKSSSIVQYLLYFGVRGNVSREKGFFFLKFKKIFLMFLNKIIIIIIIYLNLTIKCSYIQNEKKKITSNDFYK